MQEVHPPIKPNTNGERVANLHALLLFLIERSAIKVFDPPNSPTKDDLESLTETLGPEQAEKHFGKATQQLLQFIQTQQGLGDQLDGIVEATTAAKLNELFTRYGGRFDEDDGEFVVDGTVTTATGQPVAGLKVVAYDKDLRRDQFLNDASTDDDGRYRIAYRLEQFTRAEGRQPLAADLVVAVRPGDSTEPLARSPVRFHAKRHETIDLTISGWNKEPTEFERVTELVQPLLREQGAPIEASPDPGNPVYADLEPHDLHSGDVEFAASETGLDAAAIKAWAGAARCVSDAIERLGDEGPPQHFKLLEKRGWSYFFALLRIGMADDLDGVLRLTSRDWLESQRAGVARHLVSAIDDDETRGLVEALAYLQKLARLDNRRSPASPLAQVIGASPKPLPRDVLFSLLEIEAEHGLDQPELFLKAADGDPDAGPAVNVFVRTLRLHALTGGDMRLAAFLGARLEGNGHSIEALSAMSRKDWGEAVLVAQSPAAGDRGADQVAVRALELQTHVEQLHPLPSLSARLDDGSVKLADPALADLAAAIEQHPAAADALLKNLPQPSGGPVLQGEIAEALTNFGRYSRSGLDFEASHLLMNQGIASPGMAITYGPDVLMQTLLESHPVDHVDRFNKVIEQANSSAKGFLYDVSSTGGLSILGYEQPPVPAEVRENLPTLRGFFGDLDECVCRPCESVLGLPAYLVDLLNLVKTVPRSRPPGVPANQWKRQTGQSALRERRPDIFGLELSCKNAEEEVLHIDLALEVLEQAVHTSSSGDPYSALRDAKYPWLLPFDRGEAELRLLTPRLALSRETLLSLNPAASADHRAAVTLGIGVPQPGSTTAEWSILTGPPRTGADLWAAWGLSAATSQSNVTISDPASGEQRTGTPPVVLGWASILMQRTGVELEELDQILATRYLHGLSLSNRGQCKTSAMQLSSRTEADFDRLERFVRLRRKLPAWSIALVDSALVACNPAGTPVGAWQISADVLKSLAAAERARLALALQPEEILALRVPLAEVRLAAEATKNLQSQLFPWLPLSPATNATLRAVIDKVAACLNTSSQDLLALPAPAGVTPKRDQVADALTLDNLTWLYRRVVLARALELTVPQLERLQMLTGVAPFEPASTTLAPQTGFERLLDLHAAAQTIARCGLGVDFVASAAVQAADLAALAAGPGVTIKTSRSITADLRALQSALRSESIAENGSLAQRTQAALARCVGPAPAERVLAMAKEAASLQAGTSYAVDARAVEVLSTGGRPTRRLGYLLPLATSSEAADVLGVAPSGSANATLEQRLKAILDRIGSRLREQRLVDAVQRLTHLPAGAVVEILERGLEVGPFGSATQPRPAAEVLLDDAFWNEARGINPPPVGSTARPDLHNWMHRLDRLVAVLGQFAGIPEFDALLSGFALTSNASGVRGLKWRALLAGRQASSASNTARWSDWQDLLDLAWLAQADQLSATVLRDLFALLDPANGNPDATEVRPLADRLRCNGAQLLDFAGLVAPAVDRHSLRVPSVLRRLQQLVQHVRPAKATPGQAAAITAINDTATAAAIARQLLIAKQGAMGSGQTLQKIDDELRKQRRDALVAWLVQSLAKRSSDDLYEHYLIDPRVQPCLHTTRILQAAASVQLFVQRMLYGAEPDLLPGRELRRRWAWMRNYRVWEANRKVFLFPENWLFPELRDDKSSSFKLLESALGKGELNGEKAAAAFGKFLDDVTQMDQTQVLGMFEDVQWDAQQPPVRTRRDLYVVGRTTNPPYLYYWRRCESFGGPSMEWSPWQRIEADIQGDHVLPALVGGELHVFWPTFKREDRGEGTPPLWEIRFSWSRYNGSAWSRQETGREPAPKFEVAPFRDERAGFSFRCEVSPDSSQVVITAYLALQPAASTFAVPATPAPDVVPQVELPGANNQSTWFDLLNFVNRTYPIAGLSVRWRAWIKLKNTLQQEAWLELTPGSGRSIVLQDANSSWPGATEVKSWGSSSLPADNWRLVTRINGISVPDSNTQPTAEVQPGHIVYYVLYFTIDATRLDAKALGFDVDVPSTFEPKLHYIQSVLTEPKWLALGSSAPLALPRQTRPWMNGALEDSRLGLTDFGLILSDTSSAQTLEVFTQSAPDEYFVVGGSSRRSHTILPDTWHFRESASRCYVDVAAAGLQRMAAAKAYDDSPGHAGKVNFAWITSQDLSDASLQQANTGSPALPPLGPSVSSGERGSLSPGGALFDRVLPSACYHWEVFFHAPLLIADQLSKQQRFEEAERWLRFVFDPTSGEPGTDARRFLRFRVFKELDPNNDVTRQLMLLAKAAGKTATTGELAEIRTLVERWLDLPFRPFVIARRRHLAFLWRTLFAYLDNLLAWADSLYRRDTRETIDEATLLYVLAARILGPRPRIHGRSSSRPAKTYDDIAGEWDEFANTWIDVSTGQGQAFYWNPPSGSLLTIDADTGSPDGFLYFCIPFNDKLFTYWSIVESRLFNIRHCRNIEGITRDLPLTDPPIDPELLIRAAAAGLDLGAAIAGLYAPPPSHRFSILVARAVDLANEARSLGGALLAALEKRDSEGLSLLRSANELALLTRMKAVRELQLAESRQNLEALRGTRAVTAARFGQYQNLLGRKDIKPPAEGETLGDESMLGRQASGGSSEASNLGLLDQENKQIEYLGQAYGWSLAAGVTKGVAGATHLAASIAAAAPADFASKVLTAVANGVSTTGEMFDFVSRTWQSDAAKESLMAGHVRRRDEWAFQSNQVLKELKQIDRQILANQIRIEITEKELESHVAQIEQTAAVDEFMRSKYTNEELYEWMAAQLSSVHSAAYHMALDLARRAEEAARRELGAPALGVIGNEHWNSQRSGLLAGERLHQDIKRLEIAYLDQNRREYELTMHVSLRRLDPLALVKLVQKGVCEFEVPEWLFDRDTPGHYMRRIKSVSLSIPCVVGPYSSVNCTLTMLRNEVRQSVDTAGGYAKASTGDDPRFAVRYGASEAIVTSTGRDDSGLFETSMRDERYLPFEHAGGISRWRLRVPKSTAQFDLDTIADVILHLRYTAREGGDSLRDAAEAQFASAATTSRKPGRQPVVLSCRKDFEAEWAMAKSGTSALKVNVESTLLPYWMASLGMGIKKVSTLAMPVSNPDDDSSYVPDERWPTAPSGSLPVALSANGTGLADLGTIPATAKDILLVLEVGYG